MSVSVRHDLNDAFFRHRYRVASAVSVTRRVPVPAPARPYPSYGELVSGAASLPNASEISQLLRLPKIVAAIRNSEQFRPVTQSSHVTSGNQQHTPSIPTN
ncbi:hypothetical protein [Rathayibacter toxicus]|uniref:hypothetical protein n=1 Tax=Rathayibacter toxicus TaxID=145458 RepID=UPI000A622E88|nr:hypothetical protein [Rathayibacter toxicus]QOD08221.1 hypothetical protein AYW78_10355 [Rathayibacter toxicus]QWL26882.1 hypothetical protein E2R32_10180 [Rathayibacter toxicus]